MFIALFAFFNNNQFKSSNKKVFNIIDLVKAQILHIFRLFKVILVFKDKNFIFKAF